MFLYFLKAIRSFQVKFGRCSSYWFDCHLTKKGFTCPSLLRGILMIIWKVILGIFQYFLRTFAQHETKKIKTCYIRLGAILACLWSISGIFLQVLKISSCILVIFFTKIIAFTLMVSAWNILGCFWSILEYVNMFNFMQNVYLFLTIATFIYSFIFLSTFKGGLSARTT